ncbi:hypothetical protein CANMA_003779 [Candida margitis]|uniref:uncharacterized protein n=1 Tax=Candida margitis TaxID=1775924 RepID=UPI0022278A4B|nr:uncharacterized protein CANMA_003779 [Candida margitis]KAI5961802.1 hypothetical protein CANMA_003779 [Candida margitis]
MFGILKYVLDFYPVFASIVAIIGSINEPNLPSHLIALQRWLIYWATLGCVTIIENTLSFITFLPGYSLFKIGFHLWLVIPMLSDGEDWKNSGAPWLFFEYIKPQFEANKEAIYRFVSNPLDLRTVLKLSALADTKKEEQSPTAATATGYDYAAVLDSSIVMVKSMFVTREVASETADNSTEDFDIVDKPDAAEAYQRKSYFW